VKKHVNEKTHKNKKARKTSCYSGKSLPVREAESLRENSANNLLRRVGYILARSNLADHVEDSLRSPKAGRASRPGGVF
jgi:hypothetical protein